MSIVNFLVWCLVVYGVTVIVTRSKLFASTRARFPTEPKGQVTRANALGVLLNCPMCFGWWVGAALALFLGYSPVPPLGDGLLGRALHVVLSGAAATTVAWTWYVVLAKLGAATL